MNKSNLNKGCSISSSPFIFFTVLFIFLKCFGLIDWSWWWVFSPLLIFTGIGVAIFVVWILAMLLVAILENIL